MSLPGQLAIPTIYVAILGILNGIVLLVTCYFLYKDKTITTAKIPMFIILGILFGFLCGVLVVIK